MASKETIQSRTWSEVSKVQIQLLGDLVSSSVTVLFASKSRMVMCKAMLFSFVQKRRKGGTNVVALKETTQPRTVSEVSKVHIQLLGRLVLRSVKKNLPAKVER